MSVGSRDSLLPVARGHVPNPHGPVPVGGHEMPAVGTECHTGCHVAESTQAVEYLAGADIPDFHFPLFAASEALSLGAESEAPAGVGFRKGEDRFDRLAGPHLSPGL